MITIDTVALVENYPAADERVLADQIIRAGGGPASVAAVALARLGISSAIVGTVGDDQDGRTAIEIFQREGVDTSGISITKGATSGSVIIASRSQSTRAIATRQPISQIPINETAKLFAKQSQWVHVDHVGINKLPELGISRGQGPKISFDAGYGVKDFDVSKVDLFAPNDRQMSERHPDLSLADAIVKDAEGGSNTVVATMGSKGSMGYSKESGLVSAPGISLDVISTLGAGDVFHGALLAALISGQPLEEALSTSNLVAALSCRGLDGQSAIPTKAELSEFIRERK